MVISFYPRSNSGIFLCLVICFVDLAWATSHFDPELVIAINGSTNTEDDQMLLKAQKVQGNIIGFFNEKDYTYSLYTIYEHNGKTFIRTTFKDGESMDNEVEKMNSKNGVRYDYKENVSQGEYFILNNGVLEFYNDENRMFTTASKL